MDNHPADKSKAKSVQKVAFVIGLVAALIIDAFALSMGTELMDGKYESFTISLFVCVIVSLFGCILTITLLGLLLKKSFEPSLKLYFPDSEPVVGESLKGQIYVSMAASKTPAIVATLKLFRSQSDSIEFTGMSSVVWEKDFLIDKFEPLGQKQCRGGFEISLLDKSLIDLEHTGTFNWELFIRSNDPKQTFGEVFKFPIL